MCLKKVSKVKRQRLGVKFHQYILYLILKIHRHQTYTITHQNTKS